MSLGKLAFRIGRKIGKHPLAGRIFCLTERMLPVRRIARTKGVVGFHHPRPIAAPHILVIPTRPFPALISPHFSQQECADVLWSMLILSHQITANDSTVDSWALIINGGIRQEIGQMHGHLMATSPDSPESPHRIVNPKDDLACWERLFSMLEERANISASSYSLVFRWDAGSQNTVSWTID